jgi:hypothetical protein
MLPRKKKGGDRSEVSCVGSSNFYGMALELIGKASQGVVYVASCVSLEEPQPALATFLAIAVISFFVGRLGHRFPSFSFLCSCSKRGEKGASHSRRRVYGSSGEAWESLSEKLYAQQLAVWRADAVREAWAKWARYGNRVRNHRWHHQRSAGRPTPTPKPKPRR